MQAAARPTMNREQNLSQVNSSQETNKGIESSSMLGGLRQKKSKTQKEPNFCHFPGQNWIQVVLRGQLPPSRCNMGYAASGSWLYILGG